MINCLITGYTGFVGTNLIKYFSTNENINVIKLDLRFHVEIEIPDTIDCIIHLVGKAHDLKSISNPHEYYEVNFDLTKKIFDAFLNSNAKTFITLSSVKAAVDHTNEILTEDFIPNPISHYGISKLKAEQYIIESSLHLNKKYYILRPCLIHGPGNKGNFNLLFKLIKHGTPWPLGSFHNKRSYCSIDNLTFVLEELISRDDIISGIYNISDDESISTNHLIKLISLVTNKKIFILSIPKNVISLIAKIGDLFLLPFNTEKLQKLTENFIVSNIKLTNALKKELPIKANIGLQKTFKSFVDK
jgi:nucleoside-diphosphate-sugar epimerase